MENTQFPPQNQGNADAHLAHDSAQNSDYGAQNPNPNAPYSQEMNSPHVAGMPPMPPKKNKWLYWFLPLVIILGLGGGLFGWYYINGSQNEETAYTTLLGNENVQDYENYLERFPNGEHAAEVRERLAQLKTMYADWTRIANMPLTSNDSNSNILLASSSNSVNSRLTPWIGLRLSS